LGVFHAQGKGGLPINIDTARDCFIRAANLGQVQAKQALHLEKLHKEKNVINVSDARLTDADLNRNNNNNKTNYKRIKLTDYVLSINTDPILDANFTKPIREITESNEKMVENATQAFLDLLGLRDSSQASIMITRNQ